MHISMAGERGTSGGPQWQRAEDKIVDRVRVLVVLVFQTTAQKKLCCWLAINRLYG